MNKASMSEKNIDKEFEFLLFIRKGKSLRVNDKGEGRYRLDRPVGGKTDVYLMDRRSSIPVQSSDEEVADLAVSSPVSASRAKELLSQ